MSRNRVTRAATAAMGVLCALVVGLALTGVSPPHGGAERPAAEPGDRGAGSGGLFAADLDGDGEHEQIRLGRGRGGIEIRDGTERYLSRDKWSVADALIADADRNGLPEVVALLDGGDGRHLALIGWHAGQYHERLVSSTLTVRPQGLDAYDDPASGGWVVVLDEAPGDSTGRTGAEFPPRTTTYRWNGFGFTAIAGEGSAPR